jgi:hypothetical protein
MLKVKNELVKKGKNRKNIGNESISSLKKGYFLKMELIDSSNRGPSEKKEERNRYNFTRFII